MNIKIFLWVTFFMIAACSPSRRLSRLLKKHPELVKTTIVHDTITIEKVVHDTITKIVRHDSVMVINNDRVKLQYFYDTVRQEIHHEVECKEITKPYIKEVVTIAPTVKRFPWWFWILMLLAGFIIIKAALRGR